jgi:hypothetical protein
MRQFRASDERINKVENHAAAAPLYFMWYNFGQIHRCRE